MFIAVVFSARLLQFSKVLKKISFLLFKIYHFSSFFCHIFYYSLCYWYLIRMNIDKFVLGNSVPVDGLMRFSTFFLCFFIILFLFFAFLFIFCFFFVCYLYLWYSIYKHWVCVVLSKKRIFFPDAFFINDEKWEDSLLEIFRPSFAARKFWLQLTGTKKKIEVLLGQWMYL